MTTGETPKNTGTGRRHAGSVARMLAVAALIVGTSGAPLLAVRGVAEVPSLAVQSADTLTQALAVEVAALRAQLPAAEGRDLSTLYEKTGGRAAWLLPDGNLGSSVRRSIGMLADAAADGLDPADYDVAGITARLSAFPASTPAQAAALDVRLSAAVLRFYRHLHFGRVDPRTLGLPFRGPADTHDLAELLHVAMGQARVVERARDLAPPFTQYALLREHLTRYRQMAASFSGTLAFTTTVRPGDAYSDLATLHRLLVTLGDLPADQPLPAGIYDESMAAGVRRFQARHGLDTDGVIGRATQAALTVPIASRVRQFELALERLRWLPDLSGSRIVAVNIPMFRLFAWNSLPSTAPPALSMKVVVGRAVRTQTPVFADQMEHVIFRPYWNVPASILRNELLPQVRRNPAYLARQNLEIVLGDGDNSPVLPPTPDNIARLGQGGVRLRQRPGPDNSLGLIKFMFPNENDVYMHDTPATQLFQRSRRDFSHGCIRVEDPVGLAEWVMSDLPEWSRDAIVAAMRGHTSNRRIDLPEPIQVVIFYTTVIVQPEDGAVHFADDIYGHDARLEKVL
jgi:murein L,D-transpeptidase YcbB/YkuD